MRWQLALLLAFVTLLAAAVVVTVPLTSGQTTDTWYARSTDAAIGPCTGINKELSTTAGSSATVQTLNGNDFCFFTPAQSVTLESGDWTAFVELRTSGAGQASQVRITLDITDASGTVLETVADCTTGNDPNTEVQCAATGVAQKTLGNDRVRLRVTKTVGTTTVDLRYNGADGGDADTRATIPAEAPCTALTVATSDPAGQLWFNTTVEPDGQAFTTQANVSASHQNDTTPALTVTNDGTGTCDVTLRLMSDPGTGRSLKFNTTKDAPWPDDTSKEVPLDPSSVTVCSGVASGGTCQIWLWGDFENALGGSTTVSLRVESI